MRIPPLDVLWDDNHCLAVVKPPRVLTAGDETGDVSLLDQARDYVRIKYNKPGNVFIGLVHRLDRPVSGVVLFARTSKSASRLSEQFRTGSVVKTYQALVEGEPPATEGVLTDWLWKDRDQNVVRRAAADEPGARESVLRYRRLQSAHGLTLLEITPETGRSHQIRVQLSVQNMPIYGDRKYGAREGFGGAIALHAARLTFEHPVKREAVTLEAPRPTAWESLLRAR